MPPPTLALAFLFAIAPTTVLAWPASGTNFCVLSSTVAVRPQHTCADFGPMGASAAADVALQLGETEAFQILVRNDEDDIANLSVAFSPLTLSRSGARSEQDPVVSGAGGAASTTYATAQQVGYVFCDQSPRYFGSGGGWRADPLLDIPAETGIDVQQGVAQSLWISVALPPSSRPGIYQAAVTVHLTLVKAKTSTSLSLPITITAWNISLPSLRQSKIGTMWSGMWDEAYFQPYYGSAYNKTAFYDMMMAHRTPPDYIYGSSPRSIEDYEYLAANGANWFALLDVCSLPQDDETKSSLHNTADCPDYSPDYVNRLISTLAPTVQQLQQRDLLQYAYVYGFDENPESCEPQVRKLFGAVKKAYPGLRTAATLNWSPMNVTLPIDVWILQYEEYKEADAAKWVAAGKQQFWYHCIEPATLSNLNTFIERPLIQSRLLFWLAASGGGIPGGWLYYATDFWNPAPGLPRKVMRRLNGTQAFTDFNPANYIWAPTYTDIFANGDGQYIYPGEDGPISTVRLEAIRDGLEDWELFSRLIPSELHMLSQLVRSASSWTEDPILLEEVRREAADLLMARSS